MTAGVHIGATHTGSLPRPPDLTEMLIRRDRGERVDGLHARATEAVAESVRRQVAAGMTVVNDGEAGKMSYATYVTERLDGFGDAGPDTRARPRGSEEFPEFFARWGEIELARPACIGPVSHRDPEPVRVDIERLRAALDGLAVDDAFMTAASPGVVELFLRNEYYASHEEYIWALADALKPEYDAIHAGGFLLQLDCPDLPLADGPERTAMHIEALNHATRDIPPERMRLHMCWGNYEGPHNHDVPLSDIIERVLAARPAALSFEAANPRHAHEWRVFEDLRLPPDRVVIPGVIDSTTNYVEHPQLVADRIVRYARLVGRDNVIAGTDCGFATVASHAIVDPAIAWAKLRALGEGAELAAAELSHA